MAPTITPNRCSRLAIIRRSKHTFCIPALRVFLLIVTFGYLPFHCRRAFAFQLLLRLIPGVLVEDGGPFSYDESTKNLILRLGGIGVVSLQSLPWHHCRAWRCCATTLAGLLFGITHNMVFPSPSLLIPPCVYCRAQGLFTSCTMSSARLFLVRRERVRGACQCTTSVVPWFEHGVLLRRIYFVQDA
jgi:hypothetical protein